MEGALNNFTVENQASKLDQTYDKEAVRAGAAEQLTQMLEEIEVDESIPEKFHKVAALELLRRQLDQPETDNSMRHVASLIDEDMYEQIAKLSHHEFLLYEMTYRAKLLSQTGETATV